MAKFAAAYRNATKMLLAPADMKEARKRYIDGQTPDQIIDALDLYNPAAPTKKWDRIAERLETAYKGVLDDTEKAELIQKQDDPPKPRVTVVPVNPLSIKWAKERSATLVKEISGTTREGLREVFTQAQKEGLRWETLREQIQSRVGLLKRETLAVTRREFLLRQAGFSEREILKRTSAYTEELWKKRAQRIARTETVEAQNKGLLDKWQAAKEGGTLPSKILKRWIEPPITPNPNRPCPICIDLGEQDPIPVDDAWTSNITGETIMRPTAHPHCLVSDSRVLAGSLLASSSRRYYGDLVIITTALGRRLACTPNHPILGEAGFRAAASFHVGDDVIGCRLGEGISTLLDVNHQDRPAPIHEVAESFRRARQMLAVPVPTAPEHFHGDGIGSQVAVVWTNRLLGNDVHAARYDPFGKLPLVARGYRPSQLAGKGKLCQVCRSRRSAPSRFVSSPYPAIPLSRAGFGHSEPVGFRAPTRSDAGLDKSSADRRASDAEGFGQRLLGISEQIARDNVINVDVQSFHGLVLNLETGVGAYIAEGIITHNCRCTMVLERAKS